MINASLKSSMPRELVPAGTHVATLYQVVHVGTTQYMWQGKPKTSNKVRLTFEIPGEMRKFGEEAEEKPMVISTELNLSMSDKGALRPIIEGIIGTSLSDDEADGFDVASLAGHSCLITVAHDKNKEGKEFSSLKNTSPLMKGMEKPASINPTMILDYQENWSAEKFETLPDFIKDKMKTTPEYELVIKGVKTEGIPF